MANRRTNVKSTVCVEACLLLLSSIHLAGAEMVGPKAVWTPNTESIQVIMQKCTKPAPSDLHACFLREMRVSGASPEALAFSQRLYDQTHGLIGFLREFRESGRVDVAYAEYVFRANENQACYLVNGNPALIDVDNLRLLATDSLEKDARYAAIKARYPKVSIWPGDRNSTRLPILKTLTQGGQRYVVGYWLQVGCHACARIGEVQFAFDFDKDGKFLGT